MPLILLVPTLALLGFAAWRDVATRTIPDGISLALAALGLTLRIAEGWHSLAVSLAVAAALFPPLLLCHARGLIGGGDVKLLTALAIGLTPLASYQLIAATALAGGLLGLLYLILQRLLPRALTPAAPRPGAHALRRVAAVEAWRIRRSGPMPYGVAIAIGAACVLLQSPGG